MITKTLTPTQAAARRGLLLECEALQRQLKTSPSDEIRAAFDAKMAQIESIDGIANIVRIARLEDGFADTLIAEGASIEQARSRVFDRLATRSEQTQIDSHIEVGADHTETRTALMADALAARIGGPAPKNDVREFQHMRVVDMARYCLEQRGISVRFMAPHTIVQRALHSTGDFSELLEATGARVLRHGYESYQGGVRRICRESTARDFRAKSRLMLGEAPELLQVLENGEVTRGSMAESKASYSLQSFGRIFGITRQALINDDLGAFGELAARFGRAAAEFIAAQLASRLTNNAVMADGVALFHANHGNLGTAGAISIASLGEALKKMRLQMGLNGVTPIDVTPKYLVVPAALEVLARQFVALVNATQASEVNPFTGTLEVVVDPRLDAVSATAWYLAADPGSIDTIEYAFLESEPGPQIESRAGFDVEGVEMKVRLDFGSGVIDHRGLFKNAGA